MTLDEALEPWRLGPLSDRVSDHLAERLDTTGRSAVRALGEAHDARNRVAWSAERLPSPSEDEATRRTWSALLSGGLSEVALDRARRQVAPPVRDAFRALGRGLGLPSQVVEYQAARAVEALAGLVFGAHHAIVARSLEVGAPPVGALFAALGPRSLDRVRAAVPQHAAWLQTVSLVGWPEDAEAWATAVDVHLLLRAVEALPSDTDPPAWAVLKANHDRVRGRLRAVLALHPEELAARWSQAPCAAARLDRAARRWAWAWAWREARTGFAFDIDGLAPAVCAAMEPDAPPLAPIDAADEPVLRAWLLLMLGRGQWSELEAWVQGGRGRSLSTGFYRYLAEAPDVLADPDRGGRSRSYERLRTHLADGGIDAYVVALRGVAARVRLVEEGPGLRERVHHALEPWMAGTGVPMPAHHVGRFVERVGGFLGGA